MDRKIKIIFLSSSEFGVPSLKKLAEDGRFELSAVITLQDKPKGRGMETQISAIKKTALELKIKVVEISDIYSQNLEQEIRRLAPDVMVMASFGKIIPASFLNIPPHAVLNIHPSLLPKFRGPSPIQSVILKGEKETGITIMLTNEKMDAGAILKTYNLKFEIWKPTYKKLHDKLAELGANAICEVIPDWVQGKIKAASQDDSKATYTKKIIKEDGLINWSESAEITERKIRAYNAWPVCYFYFKKNNAIMRAQILEAEFSEENSGRAPGDFFEVGDNLTVQTGQGIIKLARVKPEGKREMSGKEFWQGYGKYF